MKIRYVLMNGETIIATVPQTSFREVIRDMSREEFVTDYTDGFAININCIVKIEQVN